MGLTRARQDAVGAAPVDFPYPIESVTFTTSDQQILRGWLVPAESNDRAIILLHGWGARESRWCRVPGSFASTVTPCCSMTPALAARAPAIMSVSATANATI